MKANSIVLASMLEGQRSFAFAFFLLFLAPLFSPYLINPNIAPFYFIPACAMLGMAIFLWRAKLPYIAAPHWLVISLLVAAAFTYSSYLLLVSFSLAAMVVMGHNLPRQYLDSLYKVFCISTTIIMLIALYVWLGFHGKEALQIYGLALTTDALHAKINGPFANGNVLAIIMLCGWIISAYYWLNSDKHTQWFWLCVLLFFWSFIFLSMARGTWLAQTLICIWITVILIRQKKKHKILSFVTVGIIAALAGNSLFALSPEKTSLEGVQQQFQDSIESGFTPRKIVWSSAWNMWLQHPLTGVGASQFKAHYLTSQANIMDNFSNSHGLGATNSAHNILLHLLAEYGIAGLLLWLLISFLLIRQAYLYRDKLNSIRWPAIASTIVLWFQGHGNISLTEPYPLIVFALMLGISCKPLFHTFNLRIKCRWLLISITIVCIGLLSTGIQATKSWYAFGQWLHMDKSQPNKGQLASALAKNDELYPFIVAFSFADMAQTADEKMLHQFQPMLLRALSLYQSPTLYRELFYTYTINHELEQACQLGIFIQQQRWRNENNPETYQRVCQGLLPERYHF